MNNHQMLSALRPEAAFSPESGIIRVMNHARISGKPIIPLVAGEGHQPTPAFICDAANASLNKGETFYTYQKGLPELRQALSDYHMRQFGRRLDADRFIVTGSGMQAIQLCIQAVAGAGDEVLLPTPAWPNFAAALGVMGARPISIPMTFDGKVWTLNVDALEAATTTRTRALFINSPCNPTGWVADIATLEALLKFARRHDIWIIADEVYNRFYYADGRAPSFYDIKEEADKILFVNTFSKNWAMTGWRIGWISAPPVLQQVFENLVQYSTSGVATFMQRAAIAALRDGDSFVDAQVTECRGGRDLICNALEATGKTRFERPRGAFYLFFGLNDFPDTTELGIRLVDEVGIAMSPGEAFGEGGEGFMRLCFARRQDELQEAVDNLARWLNSSEYTSD